MVTLIFLWIFLLPLEAKPVYEDYDYEVFMNGRLLKVSLLD